MRRTALRKRLVERHVRSESKEAAKRLALFLKYWPETEKAFHEGWSYKDVWRILKQDGDIDFSYSAFLNYIRKLKKRRLDCEKEKERKKRCREAGDAAQIENHRVRPALQQRTLEPGSTRVELPRFGQEAPPRAPKSF